MAGMIVALVRMLVLIWMVMKMMLLMMMTNMTMQDLLDGDSDRLHNRVLLIFFIFLSTTGITILRISMCWPAAHLTCNQAPQRVTLRATSRSAFLRRRTVETMSTAASRLVFVRAARLRHINFSGSYIVSYTRPGQHKPCCQGRTPFGERSSNHMFASRRLLTSHSL